MSTEDIAIAANWPDAPNALVETLVELRFLDGEEGGYTVHDWAEHNPYVAARPERIAAARRAAQARWQRTPAEERAAAGRHAAQARWKHETAHEEGQGASGMHATCMPPSLPTLPKPTTLALANRVPLPENFGISAQTRAWAASKGLNRLDERLEHFVGYARANGREYADWDQAFRNAIRDDWAGLTQHRNGSRKGAQEVRRTVNPVDVIEQQEQEDFAAERSSERSH